MPTIRIPVPLREHTEGEAHVTLDGETAGAVMEALTDRYPALQGYLYGKDGELVTTTYESINLLVGSEDVRELQGMETPLEEADQLYILRTWPAAISGGRQWNQPVGAEPPAM